MAFSILIVDDSATTRGLIKRALLLSGLPVTDIAEAEHGKAALAHIRNKPVDLVLADLHMPEMTGVELAQTLLSDPTTKSIPIAVVSAEPSATRILALKQAGVKGYLRKPCTPESLRELVRPFVEAAHA